MRRSKDPAYLMSRIARPLERSNTMGVASSIGGDGQAINGQHTSDGEIRDLNIALPYGISSSGIDGIRIQIITNGNQNNTVVGVIDDNKPPVKSGCIIIYDKSGTKISLNGDGTVDIDAEIININGKLKVNGREI